MNGRKALFIGLPVTMIGGFLVWVPLMIMSVLGAAASCGLVGGPGISVATWNVCASSCGNWGERSQVAGEKILEHQPDVIAVQEGGWSKTKRGHTFAALKKAGYTVATNDKPFIGRYIAYRPAKLTPTNAGSFSLGGNHGMAWARFTDADGNALVIVNAHLEPAKSADARRARQMRTGLDRLEDVIESGSTIFAGDFNSNKSRKDDAPARIMTDAGYVDARTVAKQATNANVNSAKGRSATSPVKRNGNQTDHIYVPKAARVSSWTQVVDAEGDRYVPPFITDHNMLVAQVQLAVGGDPLEETVNERQLADGATVEGLNTAQVEIAQTIIKVGRVKRLPERAQAIAVMAAIGESSLTNVAHGDAARNDTIGVFQIGPEHGAYDDRMDPAWAAGNFYKRLVAVDGWEQLEPTIAAHRAQRNADPNHYTRFWPQAQKLMSAITGSSGEMVAASTSDGCPTGDVDQASWAASGADCDFEKWATPRSCQEALAEAARIAKEQPCTSPLPGGTWRRWCLAFVARAYGYDAAGYHTALDMYRAMKARGLISTSKDIPAGALVFFTSSSSAGHVALYAGNGKAYSNDYVRSGCIDLTPMSAMGSGGRYLGWSPPAFPGA